MPIQIEAKLEAPVAPSRGPIVGIDLGTTHSLVAVVKEGHPQVLKTREGERLLPSVVTWVDGKSAVGYSAKKEKARNPESTIFSVKRLLGRSFEDLKDSAKHLPYRILSGEGIVKVQVGDKSYTAIEISALILKELKISAEEALGCAVSQAVITVPAYFNDAQRQATRTAGRLAGWDVLRIINEPTAASLAYGLNRKKQGLIAVYDLGGGTFDISILKLHDGIFEVLSTHGDTALGGDDFDRAIVESVTPEIQKQWDLGVHADQGEQSNELRALLLEAAENCKKKLSVESEAWFEVSYKNNKYSKRLTRDEFEKAVLPVLERTKDSCLRALADAGLNAEDLSDVVLVGGPTRLAIVQKFVGELFGKQPNTSVHPDEVVAEGAAIQADILSGNNKDLLLLDVVPLSLGLETYGGLMSTLIQRNTRIPTVAREVFTTFVDNQTGVDIHVLQGEREKVSENRSLARFKLSGVQPMPAGMPRVEVTFLIDADGILQVAAKDLKTGHEQSVEVRPSFGLTDSEVEKMLASGLENLEKDQKYRRVTEAKNEAERILSATEKSLPDGIPLLSSQELGNIQQTIALLKTALKDEEPEAIVSATQNLNQATVHMAELIIQHKLLK